MFLSHLPAGAIENIKSLRLCGQHKHDKEPQFYHGYIRLNNCGRGYSVNVYLTANSEIRGKRDAIRLGLEGVLDLAPSVKGKKTFSIKTIQALRNALEAACE
jgi:hypothetical protein